MSIPLSLLLSPAVRFPLQGPPEKAPAAAMSGGPPSAPPMAPSGGSDLPDPPREQPASLPHPPSAQPYGPPQPKDELDDLQARFNALKSK